MKKNRIIIPLLVLMVVLVVVVAIKNKNRVNFPGEIIVLEFEFTNVFLLQLSEGYAMIDNAYEKEFPEFMNYLSEYDIKVQEIKYILLTHHHDDHVGFLNQITSLNPNVSVILHKKTADLLATGYNNKNNGGGIINRRIYALFKLKQFFTPEWDLSFPAYFVRQNDILFDRKEYDLSEILGLDVKVVYTPGHTSDSCTYVYKDRYAFVGDLASNFLNWAGADYLTVFNENINLVYSSWEKLIDYNVEVILPAHGNPYKIDKLKDNLNRKKQKDIVHFF